MILKPLVFRNSLFLLILLHATNFFPIATKIFWQQSMKKSIILKSSTNLGINQFFQRFDGVEYFS
jgi:hypothetical protein